MRSRRSLSPRSGPRIDEDRAFGGPVPPEEETDEARLARAGGADDCDVLPGGDGQIQRLEDRSPRGAHRHAAKREVNPLRDLAVTERARRLVEIAERARLVLLLERAERLEQTQHQVPDRRVLARARRDS